jgi:class 3 adenylate cyclase
MHPLTLAFADAELERAYHASRTFRLRGFALGVAIVCANNLVWAAWARVVAPAWGDLFERQYLALVLPLLLFFGLIAAAPPIRARMRGITIANVALVFLLALSLIRLQVLAGDALRCRQMFALWVVIIYTPAFLNISFLQRHAICWSLAGLWLVALRLFTPWSWAVLVDDLFWIWIAMLSGGYISYVVDRQRRRIFLQRREIEEERAKSEQLLRNVLPEAIAHRLKQEPARIADHFDEVTVLFGDIAGFTPLSEELSPQELVAALDDVFSAFDEIAHRHGLEKIKTIGDAYMVVGGVPTPRADHADAVAEMALEMRDLVAHKQFVGGRQLRLRIGIHSGPVVAGVIGKKKFIYDLWGDTVNTASRMESHGVAGMVQVTAATAERLRARYRLTPRGAVSIKGKGEMETWFLDARAT